MTIKQILIALLIFLAFLIIRSAGITFKPIEISIMQHYLMLEIGYLEMDGKDGSLFFFEWHEDFGFELEMFYITLIKSEKNHLEENG